MQAGGGDDNVRVELLAGLQTNAMFGEGVDLIGDHGSFSTIDGLKEVRIWDKTEALVPRLVARLEMLFDVVAERKVFCSSFAE